MKTFLKTVVLLVSIGAFASSPDPALYQYWFDNDEVSRIKHTRVYVDQYNPLEIDARGLSEGGHVFNYRMANKDNQWGNVMKSYFIVPFAPDRSSSKAVDYRVWLDKEIIASGSVPSNSDFTLSVDIPNILLLNDVDLREFTYQVGEKTISMAASGKFMFAFQMLSESNEWGIPLYSEYEHSVITILPTDSVPVPCDYTFKKPDNNNFKAYSFSCNKTTALYLKASQDCTLGLYSVDTTTASNLVLLKTFNLKKGETTEFSDNNLSNLQLVAIIYHTKKDASNQDDDIFLRIMYENNKLPRPIISYDPVTWEVNITCADQRAKIHYTLDGNQPNRNSPVFNGPIKLDKFTTVKAFAVYGDLADSEVVSETINDQSMRIPKPQLVFAGGKDLNEFILTNSIEGVTTYYVIGNGDLYDEAERKTFDGKSFIIEDGALLKAYSVKELLMDSEVLSMTVNHRDYVTPAPKLRYSDGYVIAEHEDDMVEIRFTDENGNELYPDAGDPRRLKVDYNSTVEAYASKQGYAESKASRIEHTDPPVISSELFTVSIEAKTGQIVKYTTDGTLPDNSSKEYKDPFVVEESCTIRAVAFEDNLIPAEGESKMIVYLETQKPEVKEYDGRYVTLHAEDGATIHYIIGQTDTEVREGKVYNGKIDIEGLNQIIAIAQRADAADSELMYFTPSYYANDSVVYTSQPGSLKDAFGWSSDKSRIASLTVHGPLVGNSTSDSGDYEYLRSFLNLRYLDMRNVTDSYIPDGALDASNFKSIILPMMMTNVGSNIFGASNSTLCALEITSDDVVPEHLLGGIENSNLLLYVKNATNASKAVAYSNGIIKNIVVTGTMRSESVTLSYGKPFYAHKSFTANKISFTRSFNKETQLGGFGSGWETMVVPFDVQSIESAGRTLKPFGEVNMDKGECPFWLFSAGETEWKKETSIISNTPYLIAMPNNPQYADEYIVKGDVVFNSTNVTVPVTPTEEHMTYGFGVGRQVIGNYNRIGMDEGKLAINESVTTYQNQPYLPGGIFISNERDVIPFECYVESNGAKGIPVFDNSAIDDLIGDYGTRIWSESCSICIHSSIAMKLRIYDMVGQLIRIIDVKAGETIRVEDFTPGIYFVGTSKILVKE